MTYAEEMGIKIDNGLFLPTDNILTQYTFKFIGTHFVEEVHYRPSIIESAKYSLTAIWHIRDKKY